MLRVGALIGQTWFRVCDSWTRWVYRANAKLWVAVDSGDSEEAFGVSGCVSGGFGE